MSLTDEVEQVPLDVDLTLSAQTLWDCLRKQCSTFNSKTLCRAKVFLYYVLRKIAKL